MSCPRSRLPAVLLAALALGLCAGTAQAAAPELSIVLPRGARRGDKVKVRFQGRRLKDATEVLFTGPGLRAEGLAVKNDKRVDLTVVVAPDCPLGEHGLRLVTRSGISELRTFHVGRLPELSEKEPNNSVAKAQLVPLDHTINGRIRSEDVDVFKFRAKRGERISAELVAMRLGSRYFDAAIAIIDSRGFTVEACDDAPLLGQDPVVQVRIPADGEYWLRIQESAFRGDDLSWYRLHLGRFPRPLACLPVGGRPGETVRVRFFGDVSGVTSRVVTLPKGLSGAARQRFGLRLKDRFGESPAALPFRLSPLANVIARETGNGRRKPQPITVPCAVNGRLEKAGDVDWFQFKAKKGARVDFQAFGRSLGSPIDVVITVHRAKDGRYLAGNDDKDGLDSALGWRSPADGDYLLRVTDHRRRGGETFVYRVELEPNRPELSLAVPRFGRRGQARQQMAVPQGHRQATILAAGRRNFRADLAIIATGLPAGVRVHLPKFPAATGRIPVVFEAAGDAKLGAARVQLMARATKKGLDKLRGEVRQVAELVYGQPNNALYHDRVDDHLAVAVTQRVPFQVELEAPKAPLVQNGRTALRVKILRDKGFKAPIFLEPLVNPPGTSARRSVKVDAGKPLGLLPMNANGRAAPGDWPVVVVARAKVGDADVRIATNIILLPVRPAPVAVSFKRTSGEQGGKARLAATVKVTGPLRVPAMVHLVGLPRGATTAALPIKADTKALVFEIVIGPKTRPGRHRSVFAEIRLGKGPESIIHRSGRAEVRVDRPLPKKKTKPKAKPKPKPKPKPEAKPKLKAKPLNPLEALRRKHLKRLEESGLAPSEKGASR